MQLTQVKPRGLTLEPRIEDVLNEHQLLLPRFDLHLEGLDEGGAPHCLCLDDVVVQQELDVIDGRQYRHSLQKLYSVIIKVLRYVHV